MPQLKQPRGTFNPDTGTSNPVTNTGGATATPSGPSREEQLVADYQKFKEGTATGPIASGYGGGLYEFYQGDPNAWDPTTNQAYNDLQDSAGSLVNRGSTYSGVAQQGLSQTVNAPTVSDPRLVNPTNVQAATGRGDAGVRMATTSLQASQQDRQRQIDAASLAALTARGQGPSVAPGMLQEAVAGAAAGYGSAANQAGMAYGDAAAQQAYLAEQATRAAQMQRQRAAEDAIRANASMIASAPGASASMALRRAGTNQAMQLQRAAGDAAMMQQAANEAAQFQAGAVARQASANQSARDIETVRMQEQAAARAAQLQSQEQLSAMGLYVDAAGNIRSLDQSEVGAGVAVGQLGLGIDSLATQTALDNAQRAQGADMFNVDSGFRADQANQQGAIATNALNVDRLRALGALGQGDQQFGMGIQQAGVGQQLTGAVGRDEFLANQFNAMQGRRLANVTSKRGVSNEAPWWLGPTLTTAGAIGGTLVAGPAGGVAGAGVGGAIASGVGAGGGYSAASNQNFQNVGTSPAPGPDYSNYGGK